MGLVEAVVMGKERVLVMVLVIMEMGTVIGGNGGGVGGDGGRENSRLW